MGEHSRQFFAYKSLLGADQSMRANLRNAILLAPLSQIAVTAIPELFFGILDDRSLQDALFAWLSFSALTTAIAYIVTIVIGVPVHLWLRNRNLSTVRNHAFAGVFFGLVAIAILVLPQTTVNYLWFTPIVFLSSLVVATTFGALATSQSTNTLNE